MYVALQRGQCGAAFHRRGSVHLHLRWPLLLLLAGSPVRVEVTAQVLPALVVALVQSLTGLQAPLGHGHAERRLEHEGLKRGDIQDIS